MLFPGSVWSLLGVCRMKKRDNGREYLPDMHSLTHCTYAACRGREITLTYLCLRPDRLVREKNKRRFPMETRRRTPASARLEPDQAPPEARLPIGEPRLAAKRAHVRGDGVCQTTGERSHEFSCGVYTRKIGFESGMVGNAWKHGRRTPEGLPRISITGRRPQEQKKKERTAFASGICTLT